ncbi:MAG TPA: hypothetical protein VEL77_15060 [Rugosimonospora sp.]|nr:hypothetical protein [Rugosimonospora sp.]
MSPETKDLLPRERAKELVLAAIGRIETSRAQYLKMNADARIGPVDLQKQKAQIRQFENEFGWQWQNVKRLLTEMD